jgi:hypothetical protein
MKRKEVKVKVENLANDFVKIYRKNTRDINLLAIDLKLNVILLSVDIDSREKLQNVFYSIIRDSGVFDTNITKNFLDNNLNLN